MTIAGVVAVLAALSVLGLAEGVAGRDDLTRLDPSVESAVVALRDPALTVGASVVTFVASEPSLAVLTALLLAWLALRRRAYRVAMLVAASMAASAATTLALKHLMARARPPVSSLLGAPDSTYSFPSGHTLSGTVFFGLVAGLTLTQVRSTAARVAVVAGWLAASAAVGLSRLYLGYHWLTDVLAGWSAGLVILALTAAVALVLVRPRTRVVVA
ncbi:MAG: phosphatase PAP2 family protein [Actinomycetes bacterium]